MVTVKRRDFRRGRQRHPEGETPAQPECSVNRKAWDEKSDGRLFKRVRHYLSGQICRTVAIGGAPKELPALGAPNASSKMLGFSPCPGAGPGAGHEEKASRSPGWAAGAVTGATAALGTSKHEQGPRTAFSYQRKTKQNKTKIKTQKEPTAASFQHFTVPRGHLTEVKVAVLRVYRNAAHFTLKVLVESLASVAAGDLLPLPGRDGGGLEHEVLEHVLPRLLLLLAQGVQGGEGAVLYLGRGLAHRRPGRRPGRRHVAGGRLEGVAHGGRLAPDGGSDRAAVRGLHPDGGGLGDPRDPEWTGYLRAPRPGWAVRVRLGEAVRWPLEAHGMRAPCRRREHGVHGGGWRGPPHGGAGGAGGPLGAQMETLWGWERHHTLHAKQMLWMVPQKNSYFHFFPPTNVVNI